MEKPNIEVKAGESPNDPKLSDTERRRDACAEGSAGAGGVTERSVRCSAWLGVIRLASIVLMFFIVTHLVLANHALERGRPVEDSGLVEEFGHGLHLGKPFLVSGALSGLVAVESGTDPVAGTGKQQPEKGQTPAPPTATSSNTQNDAAKGNDNTGQRRDALECLKAFFGHIRVQFVIMVLSGFSIGYTVGKWRRAP